MNANYSPRVLAGIAPGDSFFQKLFISALILALLVALLPVQRAFAAPADAKNPIDTSTFRQEWSNKMEKTRLNGIFYERVRVYPADFEDPDELVLAHQYLNDYGVALRAAQRIIVNRAGFDEKGRVTNDVLANQSLKDLSENLRIMRVMRQNLDGLDGDYRILPASAVATTTSQ